jgi:SAM-dependent methyltransferase
MRARTVLAGRYLTGDGLEIGALQKPLEVPSSARVRYVDRLTLEEARQEYPELDGAELVKPDIIADAGTLGGVPDNSADFIVANHVLEHLPNPLRALENWLRVLRKGAPLYVAVPDHSNPLDRHRPITPFEHLLDSYGGVDCREPHYDEYVRSAFAERPEVWSYMPAHFRERNYAIHFHTFDAPSFAEAVGWLGPRRADVRELCTSDDPELEHIAIVVKL